MSSEMVTIASFPIEAAASPLVTRLQAEGIPVYLQGGLTADVLSYVGTAIGGVRVQVPIDQAQRALDLLLEIRSEADETAGEVGRTARPWTCPQCGETVDAGFEVCWSCGATADGLQAEPEVPQTAAESGTGGGADAAKLDTAGTAAPPFTCPMCGAEGPADQRRCWSCGEVLQSGESEEDGEPELAESSEPERFALFPAVVGSALILIVMLMALQSEEEFRQPHVVIVLLALLLCVGMQAAYMLSSKPKPAGAGESGSSTDPSGSNIELPAEPTPAELVLQRAWRAASIGVVLFPPLVSLYSIGRLIEYLHLRTDADGPLDRRFWLALILNVVVILATGLFWLYVLDPFAGPGDSPTILPRDDW